MTSDLDNLTSSYFNGIEWVGWNHVVKCAAWVDKVFPDYWVLCFAESGSLTMQMDNGEKMTISGPIAWVNWPGPHFKFGNEGLLKTWNHRFVSFRGQRAMRLAESGLFPSGERPQLFRLTAPEAFASKFDACLDALNAKRCAMAVHLLEGLLLDLHTPLTPKQPLSPLDAGLSELGRRIRQEPGRKWDFKRCAKSLNVSYTSFRRRFAKLLGMPPGQLLLNARIDRAASVLRSGSASVKEAAAQAGYDDIYYFTRLFRKVYGVPPAAYRKRFTLFTQHDANHIGAASHASSRPQVASKCNGYSFTPP